MPHHDDRSRPPLYPSRNGFQVLRAPKTFEAANENAPEGPGEGTGVAPLSPRRKRLVAFAEMTIDIAGLVILTGAFLGGCVLFVRAIAALA